MRIFIGFLLTALSFTVFASGIDPEALALLDKMEKVYDPSGKGKEVKSKIVEMEMMIPGQNIKMNLTQYYKVPFNLKIKTRLPGIMEMENGFDGKTAWEYNKAMGGRELTGKELDSFKFGAVLENPSLKLQDICSDIKFDKNGGKVDGVECVKLICTPKPEYNTAAFSVWISPNDSLMRKMEMTSVTQMGEVPSVTIYRDIRKKNDILVPCEQEVTMMNVSMKSIITKIEFNKEISDSEFKMPEGAPVTPTVPAPDAAGKNSAK
ncbi:MAG: hypothetical protein A2020_07495 [Lentisphaerae bacterium GWF2_45_14]|nr:MAG: hypothetical protein A2020_07495 [Lentisphaerae bacterium GWF2_45_14]